MRTWLIFLILIIFQPFAYSQNSSKINDPIHVIFDIDWTTFYTVDAEQKDEKTIEFEKVLYRPTDHLDDVIEKILIEFPQVRISFFSGGQRPRNEKLLKSVRLNNGRTLYEIAYKIFSFEQLTEVSQNENVPFPTRYKKVISKLIPDWNPQNTILIDDQIAFATPPLVAVESMGVYNFQQKFNPLKALEKYFPPSEEAWRSERNKALSWYQYIKIAIEEQQRTGVAFSSIARNLWGSPLPPLCQSVFL